MVHISIPSQLLALHTPLPPSYTPNKFGHILTNKYMKSKILTRGFLLKKSFWIVCSKSRGYLRNFSLEMDFTRLELSQVELRNLPSCIMGRWVTAIDSHLWSLRFFHTGSKWFTIRFNSQKRKLPLVLGLLTWSPPTAHGPSPEWWAPAHSDPSARFCWRLCDRPMGERRVGSCQSGGAHHVAPVAVYSQLSCYHQPSPARLGSGLNGEPWMMFTSIQGCLWIQNDLCDLWLLESPWKRGERNKIKIIIISNSLFDLLEKKHKIKLTTIKVI